VRYPPFVPRKHRLEKSTFVIGYNGRSSTNQRRISHMIDIALLLHATKFAKLKHEAAQSFGRDAIVA
jgi:hypothetical protein